MKKSILLLSLLFVITAAYSQVTLRDDGLYYDKEQKPFSGEYKEYYDNGQIRQEMVITDGRVNGEVVLWYRTGVKKEIRMFKSGLRDGLWVSYNEQGKKTGEASYKEDQKNGCWKIWDDHSVLRYEMFYHKGRKSGLWIMYDEEGKKISEKKYSDEQ